jgi:hypothetical protein
MNRTQKFRESRIMKKMFHGIATKMSTKRDNPSKKPMMRIRPSFVLNNVSI